MEEIDVPGRKKKHKRRSLVGIIFVLIQLIASVVAAVLIGNSKVIPAKYFLAGCFFLAVLFLVALLLQLIKSKVAHVTGIIFSILVCIAICIGGYSFSKVYSVLTDIGGAEYKTDNMIVVVRKDDPAETILDAADYIFATQSISDQENNEKMLKKLRTVTGKELTTRKFGTIFEEAQALLDGKIDAAIYNEAFDEVIEEQISGYGDQVRILYQYGVDTKLKTVNQSVKEPFNVYISGIDVYGPVSKTSRSDVNIIATVNPNTKQVLLTTTPRDYYVEIPGVSNGQKDKLTHAGIYGVDASMATLAKVYNTEINYYARVNFTSLINIVDTIGGIDVNSEYAFEAGGYSFVQGVNHMDGEMALAFSRERHSFAGGDNQRGKNQEAVLTAIINKMLEPSMLTKAMDILDTLGESVQTNVPDRHLASLVEMQLNSGGNWSILTMSAVGTGDEQACYSTGSQLLYVMQPNEVSVRSISDKINRILGGEILTQ